MSEESEAKPILKQTQDQGNSRCRSPKQVARMVLPIIVDGEFRPDKLRGKFRPSSPVSRNGEAGVKTYHEMLKRERGRRCQHAQKGRDPIPAQSPSA